MKKLLSCREVGCYECDFIVTGETEDGEDERETQRIYSYAD
jgi:hypothetical protein